MSYIGAEELVYNNDNENNIYTGGFSVKSLMMKGGMTPIMSRDHDEQNGGSGQVSDLFANLAVPSWILSYGHISGGKNMKQYDEDEHGKDADADADVIDDDLHDKLLELVKEDERKIKNANKKLSRKQKNSKSSKTNTKKNWKNVNKK
jgi:hypothetical protein